MSDNLEVENLDIDLEEAKATGEDSESADATTPEGGNPKKRKEAQGNLRRPRET